MGTVPRPGLWSGPLPQLLVAGPASRRHPPRFLTHHWMIQCLRAGGRDREVSCSRPLAGPAPAAGGHQAIGVCWLGKGTKRWSVYLTVTGPAVILVILLSGSIYILPLYYIGLFSINNCKPTFATHCMWSSVFISSLEKCLFISFALFKLGYFSLLSLWVIYIQVTYAIHDLQIFFHFLCVDHSIQIFCYVLYFYPYFQKACVVFSIYPLLLNLNFISS